MIKLKDKKYKSAPKSAKTFRAERRIERRADSLGLLSKFNYEKKIWEVWEVRDPTAFIKEPTNRIYKGRNIEKFLTEKKGS